MSVITYGSQYTFNTAASSHIDVAVIDATHFVVVFAAGNKGYAIIGTVSNGDEVAYGSAYEFNASQIIDASVGVLDSTHIAIAYWGTNKGKAIIGTISNDDEIAYGSEYTFHSDAGTTKNSLTVIDSTHFAVAYRGFNNVGKAVVGVVSSGDVIAFGSEYGFGVGAVDWTVATTLDSTHIAVVYEDGNKGKAVIGVISSGDIITFGSVYEFNADRVIYNSITTMDSSHFVVAFQDINVDTYGKAIVGVVSNGDEIAFGSLHTFNLARSSFTGVTTINSLNFAVVYDSDLAAGKSEIGTVSGGDVISYGSKYEFNAVRTEYISVATLDTSHIILVFKDTAGDEYGESKIGVLSSLPAVGTVTTQTSTNVAGVTATGRGTVTSLGSPNPTAHGVCWNTGGTPTIEDDKTDEGAASSTGAFTSLMTDLEPDTLYFVRAYLSGLFGPVYGNEVSFTTLVATAKEGTIWIEGTDFNWIDENGAKQSTSTL